MKILKDYKGFINEGNTVSGSVRVRYAPSPTGPNHIGGIRTALYNYLFAKKHNGTFILRIEDTDSQRFVPGAEQYLIDSFKWLNLEFDEGPHVGGAYGPYRQSERKDIYVKYIQQLIEKGKAYYAFETAEELDAARAKFPNFAYDAKTRKEMKNSLTLSPEETQELLEGGKYVIRIKFPDEPITITVDDIILGRVTVNSATLDDKIIWKSSDQLPTYHGANIIDDHLMKISHVIRGSEWMASAPLHIYMYDAWGWTPPQFAHLPLIMKPEGNGKLSKRDGDMGGFPVFPLKWTDPNGDATRNSTGFKDQGYLPEAVINLLAFLGWNPGTEKEVYTLNELIQDFSLEKVGKAGAKFNPQKAKWFNAQHLKNIDPKLLVADFKEVLEEKGIHKSDDFILKVLEANKGKVDFIKNLYDEVSYLFLKVKKADYDPKAIKKWKPESADLLKGLVNDFRKLEKWFADDIQKVFENFVNTSGIQFSDVAPQLRMVLTGRANGPSLFEIMEMIGKEGTVDRLTNYDSPVEFSQAPPVVEKPVEEVPNNQPSGNDAQDKEKMKKEIEMLDKIITGSKMKLNNPSFVERAPKDVVEKENQKVVDLTTKWEEMKKEYDERFGK